MSPLAFLLQKLATIQITSIHLFFFLILINPSSSSSRIIYSEHCNSIVPESIPIPRKYSLRNNPYFNDGYYIGGDKIINPNYQSSPNFPKGVDFRVNYPLKTNTEDVLQMDGELTFRTPIQYRSNQFQDGLTFYLEGFWSQATGKLCMVGAGARYSKEGILIRHYVVFKLNCPLNSTILTSMVSGTLESVNKTDSLSYFEPISFLAFAQFNYVSTLILNERKSGFSNWGDGTKGLPLSLAAGARDPNLKVSHVLSSAALDFELDYETGCNEAKKCSPINGETEFFPSSIAFNRIQYSGQQRLRMLIGFYNSSFSVYDQPFIPERMLVAEGAWDAENNRLHLVACRILNVTGSLVDSSVGDCSIRLSLWFPATLSLRTRSSAMGHMWSSKTKGESGYFGRISFRSMRMRTEQVPGLKYEYKETGRVTESCVWKKTNQNKGNRYPDLDSNNMKFDIRVGNDKLARGYITPLTIGDQFYEKSDHLFESMASGSAVNVSGNPSILLNTSYRIKFTPPTGSVLADQLSYTDEYNRQVYVVAEGIYNTETGDLCMKGCRFLTSNYSRSIKRNSMDCEIIINIQFPEINAKRNNIVKGSIKSTRGKSDLLYFDQLDFASPSLYNRKVVKSASRMDSEITMVLNANMLSCVFVLSQLFYVKKHPEVLPSISVVMLIILTLGHMIPVVLNLLLTGRNWQNFSFGSGRWLEEKEVLMRISAIAFLLEFYLLQLTWSSRLGDGNQKAFWLAEKKALYVFLPLSVGGFIACFIYINYIYWLSNPYKKLGYTPGCGDVDKYRAYYNRGSFPGLLRDGFLLPQILLNVFLNSKDKALSPAFYFGTTAVRMLPHAYDLYRDHTFVPSSCCQHSINANHLGGIFSTAWDTIILCGGLLFAVVIYFQQRFGGSCFLPRRFRTSTEYEKVPVTGAIATGE